MRGAPDITNVVEAATFDGRQERLENMQAMLEQCEKALQVRHSAVQCGTAVGTAAAGACGHPSGSRFILAVTA